MKYPMFRSISYRSWSRTGVMYSWVRWDNLVVDGGHVVSKRSVHGRGSLFNMYGLLHFTLVSVLCTNQDFEIFHIC